jgi:hypothetical protein
VKRAHYPVHLVASVALLFGAAQNSSAFAQSTSSSHSILNSAIAAGSSMSPLIGMLLGILIGAGILLWLMLATASSVKDRAFGREIVDPRNQLAPYRSRADADFAARERYGAIDAFLRRTDSSLERMGSLRVEFLERHSDLPNPEPTNFENDAASSTWQAVRLLWQIKRPERLLAERVADVMSLLSRPADLKNPSDSAERDFYVVRLAPLPRKIRRRRSQFPWRVVIESSDDNMIVDRLRELLKENHKLKEWLGIGVDWRYSLPPPTAG